MIESPDLLSPGIRHGFFGRQGGASTGIFAALNCGLGSGDAREAVIRNRGIVAAALGGGESDIVTAHQVHSAEAMIVRERVAHEERPKLDGLVTDRPGIILGTLTADCAPVLFADAEARVIGAAHAGWKGALTGVTDATVRKMEELGAARSRIAAVIGPTISKANYEVGPEFRERFPAEASRFFSPSVKSGHSMFDLPGYLADRMRRSGIGTVIDLALCTYADEARFFSYRRATHRGETDYGRQIAAITLA
jgi:YfiH family protein